MPYHSIISIIQKNLVLSSLVDATEYVGSEQYATCSAILPLEAFLHRLLMVNDDDPGYIARFKTSTLNVIKPTELKELMLKTNIANGCGLRSTLQEIL